MRKRQDSLMALAHFLEKLGIKTESIMFSIIAESAKSALDNFGVADNVYVDASVYKMFKNILGNNE